MNNTYVPIFVHDFNFTLKCTRTIRLTNRAAIVN